jgi:single-strand DNA-binding protein
MPNYNKIILVGHLTRDVTMAYLPSQTAVAEIGLASSRKFKTQSGEAREETCFISAKAFGKQAETLSQYVKKGDPILVEGRLSYQQWETKEGQKRSKHEIIVESFQFLGGKATSEHAREEAGNERRQEARKPLPTQDRGGRPNASDEYDPAAVGDIPF